MEGKEQAGFRGLIVYQKAFDLAMEIFQVTKNFPAEERYSLTDQIRRSSRSVCANLAESYRKRKYKAHFVSKLSDADMENSETRVWLEFSLSCEYISKDKYKDLVVKSDEIGRLLGTMIFHPEKFL